MLGIFRIFENAPHPVTHYWGVPIVPHEENTVALRSITDGFACGLCWRTTKPGKRRHDFPSWSWTGWTCHVKFDEFWPRWLGKLGIRIWLQMSNRPVDSEDFWKGWNPAEPVPNSPSALGIAAYTLDLIGSYDSTPLELKVRLALHGDRGHKIIELIEDLNAVPDRLARLTMNPLKGIIMSNPNIWFYGRRVLVLVVSKYTHELGETYERIGSFYLKYLNDNIWLDLAEYNSVVLT